jgi:hypothetical protein
MANNRRTDPTSGQSSIPLPSQHTVSAATFTVSMHPKLVDELDEGFSPMDGLVAIDEMFGELPLLHRALAPARLRKRAGRTLKVYRGCYDWYRSLGFSYVQLGRTQHVLELWFTEHPNRAEVDVILGTGQTAGYEPFETQRADAQTL